MRHDIQPDIFARVTMYPADQTGRPGTFGSEYWPCLVHFPEDGAKQSWDARILLFEHGAFSPGEEAELPIKFLNWALVRDRIRAGVQFEIRNPKPLGNGTVTRVLGA
jgi:hypothetical protein